jgi:hypothetical protein
MTGFGAFSNFNYYIHSLHTQPRLHIPSGPEANKYLQRNPQNPLNANPVRSKTTSRRYLKLEQKKGVTDGLSLNPSHLLA